MCHKSNSSDVYLSVWLDVQNQPRRNVRPLAVLRSFSACSGLARLRTLRNSATLCRIRLCMYAFEHLTFGAL